MCAFVNISCCGQTLDVVVCLMGVGLGQANEVQQIHTHTHTHESEKWACERVCESKGRERGCE